jgi:hypothetical protein
MKEYLVHDFLRTQIIVDTHYEIITKLKRKKRKKMENIKEDISTNTTILIVKQET